MKKILYIVSTLKRSGPTNQLFNVIANLDKEVVQPILVTLSPEPKDSKWQDYESLGIEMHSLNLSRLGGLLFAKSKIKSLIKDVKPDLIHTQGIRADSLLASLQINVPWMLTARNFPFEDYPMKFGKVRGALMAHQHVSVQKKCSHVIACSNSIKKQLESIGVQSSAIQNGVNLPAADLHKTSVDDFEAPVFVTVGSLIPRKNNRLLIEAFCLWKSKTQASGSLVLLGDGVERDALETIACDAVHFMGNVSNVSDYLASADYFLSASLSEGLPNTVLEALASGLPVILSDIPSHQEIHNACNGASRLFKLADRVDGLVKELEHVSVNFEAESKQDAKRVAKEVFSAEVMSQHYQEYYLKLLEGK